jgi:hypothetical protein
MKMTQMPSGPTSISVPTTSRPTLSALFRSVRSDYDQAAAGSCFAIRPEWCSAPRATGPRHPRFTVSWIRAAGAPLG